MDTRRQIGDTTLHLIQGDITEQDTAAIVNAANSTLLGGGGVDGAIHRAGGPAILAECEKIVADIGSCPTGEAVITTGGRLKAEYVIHTVGPVWRGGDRGEPDLLASAYRSSLLLAAKKSIASVSFPSISTGAYRFPVDRAAAIALGTVIEFVRGTRGFGEIRFVLFSEDDLAVYADALSKIT